METTNQQHQIQHQNDVTPDFTYADPSLNNLIDAKQENVQDDHGISPTIQQQYDHQQYQDQQQLHYQRQQDYLINSLPHHQTTTNLTTNDKEQLLQNQIDQQNPNDFTRCQQQLGQQNQQGPPNDPVTNGNISFYVSDNQDQAQYLQPQQQQHHYPDQADNKLYTNLDQQSGDHRVRFVNSQCEATSSTGTNYQPANQNINYRPEQQHHQHHQQQYDDTSTGGDACSSRYPTSEIPPL